MIAVILAEFVITVAAGTSFLVIYLKDSAGPRSMDAGVRAASHHLVAATLVVIGETASLFLLAVGVPVPMWLFAVGYGIGAAVMVHRNILVIRARRKGTSPRAPVT